MERQRKKSRNTKQRAVILDILKKGGYHPTAEAIYHEARKVIPNISLGTVYRNLNFLRAGAGPGDPLGQRFLLAVRGEVPPSRPFPLHEVQCDPRPSVPPVPRGDSVERGNLYLLGELPGPARHRRLQPLRTGGIL